jgi:acyl carrier protein
MLEEHETADPKANRRITAEEIRNEIKRLVAVITEKTPEEISDTAPFIDELGVDSLAALEILVEVDRKFRIDIPEEEFAGLKSVNDAVLAVQRYLPSLEGAAA